MIKRGFDLFWAVVGLTLLWPLFAVVAILIKLEDGGAVFFRQVRVGWKGRAFRVWKFRTMVEGADKKGPALTVGEDPRITRIGRWLRSTKVDELPQLINVLVGEMSLVGPRPEVQKYVDLYTDDQRIVLSLKPGITDLASIKYRRESDFLNSHKDPERVYLEVVMPDKIRINLEYSARSSPWEDLKVILLTLGLCLRQP